MAEAHIDGFLVARLTILAEDDKMVLTLDLSQVDVSHLRYVLLGEDPKAACSSEMLHFLLCRILDFSGQINCKGSEVRWHLELQAQLLAVFEAQTSEVLRDRDVVDVVLGGKDHFAVLEHLQVSFSAVNLQLGNHDKLSAGTDQERLLVDVELAAEAVALVLASEVAELGEIVVNHNDLRRYGDLTVRNEYSAVVFIGSVELVVKVDSSALPVTNLFFLIDDVGQVSSYGGPVDK